ncbi:MAG: hypothetical protein ACRCY3_12435 [Sphingorhabdus sp.]
MKVGKLAIPVPRGLSYLALAFLGAATQIVILISPLLLGWAVRRFGLSVSEAGLLIASEFAGLTVISFATPILVRFSRRRRVAIVGIALGVAMQAFTSQVDSIAALFLFRFLSGVGIGLMGSIASMSLSNTPKPGHAVAVLSTVVVLQSVLIFGLDDTLQGQYPDILLYLIAFSVLLGLPLLGFLPDGELAALHSRPFIYRTTVLLLAYGLWIMSNATVWSFTERIGNSIGLAQSSIDRVLGVATLCVFLGMALYFLLSGRRKILLITSLFALGLSFQLVVAAASLSMFMVSLSLCVAASSAGTIFFLDFIARYDRSGRTGAMSAGVSAVSTAGGPALGSAVIAIGAYPALASAAILQLVLCFAVMFGSGLLNVPEGDPVA